GGMPIAMQSQNSGNASGSCLFLSNKTTKTEETSVFHAEEAFTQLWEAYPTKGRVSITLAQQYFCEEIRDQQTFDAALESVTTGKWAKSAKWRAGFVKALPAWIHDRAWETEDPEPADAAPTAFVSTMNPETRRRIQESMR